MNTEQRNLSSYFERVVPVLNVSQGTSDEVNLGFFLCVVCFLCQMVVSSPAGEFVVIFRCC